MWMLMIESKIVGKCGDFSVVNQNYNWKKVIYEREYNVGLACMLLKH
jgi:hypothetical protein